MYINIPPDIVPSSDGGLQLEWFVEEFETEVLISPSSPTLVYVECNRFDEPKEFTIKHDDISKIASIFKELRQ